MIICLNCKVSFSSDRALSVHLFHNEDCKQMVFKSFFTQHCDVNKENESRSYETNIIDDNFGTMCSDFVANELDDNSVDSDDDNSFIEFTPSEGHQVALLERYRNYLKQEQNTLGYPANVYKSAVTLLNILKKSNAPLYLFDELMLWASSCCWEYTFDFSAGYIPKRDPFIKSIKTQFDYNCLEPKIIPYMLPGSNVRVDIVIHDFLATFYTLVNDETLMHYSNLLIDTDDLFKSPSKQTNDTIISDVDTGSVWYMAYHQYVNPYEKELLCPIIFFIDKTHTDRNGRLCIEQIRYTLGIFKRHVRNQSSAWRTLGYILDQSQLQSADAYAKVEDYQGMTKLILASFQKAQNDAIAWNLKLPNEENIYVAFRIPVLFIIGDTDGHDKMVGKFGTRTSNVRRLCRYCDCPFESTDDPYFKYQLNKAKTINNKICKKEKEELREMSFHCVSNAWADILFCDSVRGIFGATPAEIMHCIQQGLYEYILRQLFEQKKIKKNSKKRKKNYSDSAEHIEIDSDDDAIDGDENWNDNVEMSSRYVFSDKYGKLFDQHCKQYGYWLMHQSDRNLPRTHFSTNYTSVGYKNANEMIGIIIVILVVFSSSEGSTLDLKLGDKRTSQYIHLFEIMLMMEHFCKQDSFSKKAIKLLGKTMPLILNTLKLTLDRQDGNQMKIIKFHLPLHFSEDMLRFGSMSNYDTGVGESHHKVFAKQPAKNTQRRKIVFEQQTAKRQIENLVIDRAYEFVFPSNLSNGNDDSSHIHECNKGYTIEFCHKKNDFISKEFLTNHKRICHWKDNFLQSKLRLLCIDAIEKNYLIPPIKFFTQHNRNGNIFRADPNYNKNTNDPWYDWAYVDWGDQNNDMVPAKLLIFMEIERNKFNKAFKFGDAYIMEPGSYAITYSFLSNDNEAAHLDSRLITYGRIETSGANSTPVLYPVIVQSLVSCCLAVPFDTQTSIIDAKEWLIIKSRDTWNDTFISFMTETQQK